MVLPGGGRGTIGVAETEKEALELYKEPSEDFFDKCLHVDARFAAPPGYVTEATQRAGLESQVGRASQTVNAAAAQRWRKSRPVRIG